LTTPATARKNGRMRCFFCLEEREPTEEHVFPHAIGGTLTIDRVCKPCNDFLGAKVDVLLTNHELILIKRADRLIVEMPLNPAYDLGANVFGHLEYFEQCADGVVRESFEGDWIGDDRVGLKMGAFVQLVERRASDLPDNRSYPPPQRDFLHLVAILRDDKLCQMAT
jgi:hypothetical protein